MMGKQNIGGRDANEAYLIAILRALGGHAVQMDQYKRFDLVACHYGRSYLVEVKNPLQRWVFTKAEKKLKAEIGDAFHVWENRHDLFSTIGVNLDCCSVRELWVLSDVVSKDIHASWADVQELLVEVGDLIQLANRKELS